MGRIAGGSIMNILDWILIFVGALWVLRGLMRGGVSQIFGIAGILAGFYVASNKYQMVGVFIKQQFPSIPGAAVEPLSFILLFLLTWFVMAVAGHWIVRLLHMSGLGFLDRLWGAMIGFCKALLFAIVVISALVLFSPGQNPTLIAESKLAPMVMKTSQYLFKLAPSKVQAELNKRQQELKKLLDSLLPGDGTKEKGGKNKAQPM
jgi:membrane protein required for colicin V production